MSPWFLLIFLWMVVYQTNVRNVGARLRLNGVGWALVTYLFVDNSTLLQSVKGNFRVLDEFCDTYIISHRSK